MQLALHCKCVFKPPKVVVPLAAAAAASLQWSQIASSSQHAAAALQSVATTHFKADSANAIRPKFATFRGDLLLRLLFGAESQMRREIGGILPLLPYKRGERISLPRIKRCMAFKGKMSLNLKFAKYALSPNNKSGRSKRRGGMDGVRGGGNGK